IRTLLRKIYQRLPAGGALLIAEKLLADDKTGPMLALMQSLNMVVCTEGKERTVREYELLLKQAGFGEVQGRQTTGPLDAVLATKIDSLTPSQLHSLIVSLYRIFVLFVLSFLYASS